MMVGYRISNIHSMNADNQTFQEVTDKMVNNYFTTTKPEKTYNRYQEMWVKYAEGKKSTSTHQKMPLAHTYLTFSSN